MGRGIGTHAGLKGVYRVNGTGETLSTDEWEEKWPSISREEEGDEE